METQEITVVVLRVYALHCLVGGFCKSVPSLVGMIQITRHSPIPMIIPWGSIVIIFSVGFIIWFLARPIARLIIGKASREINFGNLNLSDLYTFAFLLIGLFYAVGNLAHTLNWGHYIFKLAVATSGGAWRSEVDWYSALALFIPFIIGLALIIKARFWANRLWEYHKKDSEPVAPADG